LSDGATPSVIDDVAEFIAVTTIFSVLTVLIYSPMRVVVSQMPVATD
jgi:hypothetical protein